MGGRGRYDVEDTLIGLGITLIIVLTVAARFVARPATAPLDGGVLTAKIVVLGGAAFSTGLVAVGVTLPAGAAALRANGSYLRPVSTVTELRIIVCVAGVIAHYTPSAGYFPLPGWAGFAVLGGYTAALLGFAFLRLRRRSSPEPRRR